jgi:hypothetical protein
MDGYYAYIIDADGHVINRVDLVFENEKDAIERAKGLVAGHDVELWQRDRKIAIFRHDHKPNTGTSPAPRN